MRDAAICDASTDGEGMPTEREWLEGLPEDRVAAINRSRVTCGPCAARDNTVVVCTLRQERFGRITATCPDCGHSEIVVPK